MFSLLAQGMEVTMRNISYSIPKGNNEVMKILVDINAFLLPARMVRL